MTIQLTPEQELLLEEVRRKWIAIGMSTDTIDQAKATEALAGAYAQIGRECPPIIFEPSPKACVWTRARFLCAWDRLNQSCTTEQLHELAATITDDEAKSYTRDWADNVLGGNTWAGWHGWTEAMRKVGVPDIERVDAINAVAEQIHLWWPYEQVVIVCDRPSAIRVDERDRLHGEGVPAVEYRDGWGMWIWHDVDATEAVIKGDFGKAEFLAERNAEVRRVMAEVKGWEWMLEELGGQRGATDEYGTLWTIDLSTGLEIDNEWDRPQVALVVDVLNSTPEPDGTIKRYLLSVDPEACAGLSPTDCIGWTFSLPPGAYRPWVMS